MIKIIAAVCGYNKVIGVDGNLPWHIPEDLKRFKAMTEGDIVLMGRKTYESIGKPLPDRLNWVVSSNPMCGWGSNVFRWNNPNSALETARRIKDTVWVIGGSSLFEAALPMADEVCITWVNSFYKGDTVFPRSFRAFSEFLPIYSEYLTKNVNFVVYQRKKNV